MLIYVFIHEEEINRKSLLIKCFDETNIWEVVRNRTIRSKSNLDPFVAKYKASLCVTVSKCLFEEIQAMHPYRGSPILKSNDLKKSFTIAVVKPQLLHCIRDPWLYRGGGFAKELRGWKSLFYLVLERPPWKGVLTVGDMPRKRMIKYEGFKKEWKNDLRTRRLTWETNSRNLVCSACQRKAYYVVGLQPVNSLYWESRSCNKRVFNLPDKWCNKIKEKLELHELRPDKVCLFNSRWVIENN